jgi:hypothetical protein
MTLSDLAARVTGEYLVAKYTGHPEWPSPAEVARLAYEFYEINGRQDGRDLDDWLSAEQQLTDHVARAGA